MSLELMIQRIERDNPAPGGSMEEILGYLKDYMRILKALPQTSDGVAVVPGMILYLPDQDEEDYPDGIASVTAFMQTPEVDCMHWDFDDFYSTAETSLSTGPNSSPPRAPS